MIPKKIHYCWFGGNPLPQDALMCIESWKKYFPDYEIIEWNEKNFDMNSCDYIREAAENKKWAFVSDFARFKILYDFGGIYFDTDVEVVRNFDEIIAMGAFMGKEEPQDSTTYVINPGLGMAAEQGNGFCLDVIEYYKTIHFDFNNIITVCEHVTRCLKKKGYKDSQEIPFSVFIQYVFHCIKTNRDSNILPQSIICIEINSSDKIKQNAKPIIIRII